MSLGMLLSIWGINALAAMSPGPDFVVAVKNSMKYGRVTGVWTALGFALGVGTHLLYLALGLGYVIAQSMVVFLVIKYLGVAYLLWLGLSALLSKESKNSFDIEKTDDTLSTWKAFKQGYITNILNPKATLFYLSLFTLSISPGVSWEWLLILSFGIVVTVFLRFVFVAYVLTMPVLREKYLRVELRINRMLGGVLTTLACIIAFKE